MNTNDTKKPKRNDLLYPELSYSVVGVLFDIFNELGYGYREKYYQSAVANEFKALGIPFKKEIRFPVIFRKRQIGWHIFDFLVDDKIVVELKQGNHFSKNDIKQSFDYLKNLKLKLAILARFTRKGLCFKRIVNIY